MKVEKNCTPNQNFSIVCIATNNLFKQNASVLPDVIVEMIFSYFDEDVIIHFQKKFPRLLRTIIVDNPYLILEPLQHHIRTIIEIDRNEIDAPDYDQLTD